MVNTSVSSCFTPSEDELPTGYERGRREQQADFQAIGGTDVWCRVPSALGNCSTAISPVTDDTVFVRVEPLLSKTHTKMKKNQKNRVVYALDADDPGAMGEIDGSGRGGGGSRFWEARDLASSRLLPLVNGQRSVAELARISVIDVNIARLCLAQLSQLGAVRVVSAPIFVHPTSCGGECDEAELFSVPGYIGLPRLQCLTTDSTLRDACFASAVS